MPDEGPKTTPLEKVEQRIEAVNLPSGEKMNAAEMSLAVDKAYGETKKNIEDQMGKAIKTVQELGDSETVAYFQKLQATKLQQLDAQRANCYQRILELQSREQEAGVTHKKEAVKKVRASYGAKVDGHGYLFDPDPEFKSAYDRKGLVIVPPGLMKPGEK